MCSRTSTLLGLVLLYACTSPPAGTPAPRVTGPAAWGRYTIGLTDGRAIEAESARVVVPENRARNVGRSITLHLIRLRAARPTASAPLVFLDGAPDTGPTSATIRQAALWPFFDALRESRDVILMDYRGSGLSTALVCPYAGVTPTDLYTSRETALAFFSAHARACRDAASARGVDLAGYTWAEVAADVAALRDALDAQTIDLLGFSSGTHAALATVKRFGTGIGRIALIGTEGLDDTRKLPSDSDRQIARIAALVREDSVLARELPDFVGTVRTVLERADSAPFAVRLRRGAGDTLTVSVGRFGLAYLAAKSLSGPSEIAQLVRVIGGLERGDLTALTALIQRAYSRPGGLNGLTTLLDGTAGVSRERLARIQREAATALLGDAASFPYEGIRDAWGYGDLGDAYRARFQSSVPALFITGELDGNTPPAQAEIARRMFRTSTHLVIERAGHSTAFRMPEVAALIAEFLDGSAVGSARLAGPPINLRR